jgi:hypothetical protein
VLGAKGGVNVAYTASAALQPFGLGPSWEAIDVACCLVHSMAAKHGFGRPDMEAVDCFVRPGAITRLCF